jgi:hypothetical protein
VSVQLPAIFSKITSRADGSFKLEYETRELGSGAAELMGFLRQEGWLLFDPNELQESDIPKAKADSLLNQKSQAERQRAIIYRIWQAKGEPGNSEDYYQKTMTAINDQLKAELSRLVD